MSACAPKIYNVEMMGYMNNLKDTGSALSIEVMDERTDKIIYGKAILESGDESTIRFDTDPMLGNLIKSKLLSLNKIGDHGLDKLVIRIREVSLVSRISSVGPHRSSAEIEVDLELYEKNTMTTTITIRSESKNNSVSSSVITEVAKAIITDMINDLSDKIGQEITKSNR
ncbi:hypothetical protein ACFLZI_02370 [Nitrospirota bacterium]